MGIKLKNNTSSTLATAITASDTAIVVADGSQFPALSSGDYFYATLVSPAGTLEIVKVTARVSNSLTVVRAQDGSSAAGFQVGSLVDMRVNAQSIIDAIIQLAQAEYQVFTGTGSQTVFTLSSIPADVTAALVVVNGLVMTYTSDYTISGATLTFTSAPALNDEIVVKWGSV